MAARNIAEDDMELYALDRLPESDAAPVEEHLPECEEYRERLAGWDAYMGAIREALRRYIGTEGRRKTLRPECRVWQTDLINPQSDTSQLPEAPASRHQLGRCLRACAPIPDVPGTGGVSELR